MFKIEHIKSTFMKFESVQQKIEAPFTNRKKLGAFCCLFKLHFYILRMPKNTILNLDKVGH